jgi:periplasmic divalent cation tolerance protein
MEIIEVSVACKSEDEAKYISSHLLEERFIACSHINKIYSMFHWKGNIHNGDEWMISLVSLPAFSKHIVEQVKLIHSYELPVIIVERVDVSAEVHAWVTESVRPITL